MEEDGASKRTLTGECEKFIFSFALAMALFHIYALVLSSTTAWYLYCVHVGAGAVMTFALYRGIKKSPINRPSAPDVVLMVLIAAAFTYMCVEMNTLVYRIGVNPNTMDLVVAVVVIVCVLEITRCTCVISCRSLHCFQLGTDALFLIYPGTSTDLIGLGLCAAAAVLIILRNKIVLKKKA